MAVHRMEITPLPPSANDLWEPYLKFGRGGKRYTSMRRTDKYTTWLNEVVLRMKFALPKLTRFPVHLRIELSGGDGLREENGRACRDLDNFFKATQDALSHAERIPDDTVDFIDETSSKYYPPKSAGDRATCILIITEPDE